MRRRRIFLHEFLLESEKALHYPKGERVRRRQNFDDLHENLIESVIHYPKGNGMRRRHIFDYLHENLLESVEALHHPKGEKSTPQAKF